MKRYFLPLFLALLSASCSKFLDKKTTRSVVSQLTLDQAQALLDYDVKVNRSLYIGELGSDEYFMTSEIYNASADPMLTNSYLWGGELVFANINNDWARGYEPVYFGNVVLEQLNAIPREASNALMYDQVKGHALFARSMGFLNLVHVYSKAYDPVSSATDLGIPLRMTSDFNERSVRPSVKEVYDRVLTDLKEAARLLPAMPLHVARPAKAAAFGMLSRAYLSMREYELAGLYADSSLRITNALLDYNQLNAAAAYPMPALNAEVIHYVFFGTGFEFSSAVDTVLYDSYAVNDLRKTLFFRKNANGYYSFRGSYLGSSDGFGGLSTGEMYLVRAECFARVGRVADALKDLNTLLVKRHRTGSFVPVTAASGSEALTRILAERRKELVHRGLRWIDIKRLNKGGANITLRRWINNQFYELPPNDNRYAVPLPADIIDLTGMPQNPR